MTTICSNFTRALMPLALACTGGLMLLVAMNTQAEAPDAEEMGEPADITTIVNFIQYADNFASAGQPSEEQLKGAADAGYRSVVYVAFSDHKGSLANEDRVVKSLGMSYLQVPVDWQAPTYRDFEVVAAALHTTRDERTLLHCQMNFRASAFALLYRVIYEQVPLAEAKADMNSIWTPDATWTQFILDTLRRHDVATDCDGCDWSPTTR